MVGGMVDRHSWEAACRDSADSVATCLMAIWGLGVGIGPTLTRGSHQLRRLAGLTAVLLTYPLELVRTRMAYRICDGLACEATAISMIFQDFAHASQSFSVFAEHVPYLSPYPEIACRSDHNLIWGADEEWFT